MKKLTAEKIEHGAVMCHPGGDRIPAAMDYVNNFWHSKCQHYGWPGITRTLDGDLLVSASERIRHVDPYGRTVVSRSTDGGLNWSEPQVVFDSITDDRDHALNTLPDGTIVSTWFTSKHWSENPAYIDKVPEWQKLKNSINPDTLEALSRGWLRRSHDGGKTWEEKIYPTIIGNHAGPSVLSNGDMIYCGSSPDRSRFLATRSDDGGITWSVTGELFLEKVAEKSGQMVLPFNENHCLEIAPDHILCALRGGGGNVHITRTEDGGKTWKKPENLGIHGYPPYLLKLSKGPIMCLFSDRGGGDRGPSWAIRAIFSYDDGKTWDIENVLTIREFSVVIDMGYPVGLEVKPGEIFCAFYSVPVPDMTPDYENWNFNDTGILSARIFLKEE